LSANGVCLVSGSSSGIGTEIATYFASQNFNIVVNYNSGQERAETIATEIRKRNNVEVLVIQADLTDPEAASNLVKESYVHFGRLDVCISNSGVANYIKDEDGKLMRFRFQDTPTNHLEKEMQRVLSLNLLGSYRLGQNALSVMIEQAERERGLKQVVPHRSILFVTSISDVAPEATRIPYGVSKSGINHAVLGAALEGGPHNITVNGLRPGVVDTPLTSRPSGIHDPSDGREYTVAETYGIMAEGGAQPIERIGTPEEIARAAYYFCHIPYMTGQLIAVDGGFTLNSGFVHRDLFFKEGLRKRNKEQ